MRQKREQERKEQDRLKDSVFLRSHLSPVLTSPHGCRPPGPRFNPNDPHQQSRPSSSSSSACCPGLREKVVPKPRGRTTEGKQAAAWPTQRDWACVLQSFSRGQICFRLVGSHCKHKQHLNLSFLFDSSSPTQQKTSCDAPTTDPLRATKW